MGINFCILFITSRSKTPFSSLTTLDNQMTYPDYEYFLEFSSKEEYLQKRSEWREAYKNLSDEIRHNKNSCKEVCRFFSETKKPKKPWNEIPETIREYTRYYDATKMLEIRHQQKALSKEQREKALVT